MQKSAFTIVVLSLITVSSQASDSDHGWYPSYEAGEAAAREQGLPMLLHFYAPWCGPCRQMKNQVFTDARVQQQLRNGLVAVEIDITKRKDLVNKFKVSTIPRDIVVYPGKAPETVGVGFQSRTAYLALLSQLAVKTTDSSEAVKPDSADVKLVNQEKPPLGLNGFCPVTLVKDRKWVTGSSEFSYTWRGMTYYFSSEEARREFEADPLRFEPQNFGCDPVVLYAEQKAVTGKLRYGAFFDNRLYLFESFENRSEFKKNPLKYTRIRHAIKVEELAGQKYH